MRELVDGDPGTSIYYEPHCDFDMEEVRAIAPVDFVITSAVSGMLFNRVPILYGDQRIVSLLQATQAKVVVPLRNDVGKATGILTDILSQLGSPMKL